MYGGNNFNLMAMERLLEVIRIAKRAESWVYNANQDEMWEFRIGGKAMAFAS